jgi:hypothetical protein
MAVFGIEALRFLEVTPTQLRILEAMIEIYPRTASAREIADRVYALDPSGGPESGENQMAVQMTKMRPKLRSIGWDIGAAGRRRGGIRLWAPGDREMRK